MERTIRRGHLPEDATPVAAAAEFLDSQGYDDVGQNLVFYRGEFYAYRGTHYKMVPKEVFKYDVLRFLQQALEHGNKTTISFVKNVTDNIAAMSRIDDELEVPFFLNSKKPSKTRLIAFKNGIFDLDRFLDGEQPLLQHTEKLFSTNCLPYNYTPEAAYPLWQSFLDSSLPDKRVQGLLQEWIGYNLTSDTSLHKFVLLYGDGANGKSVITTVMRELLGRENISAVSLEQFSPTRTFPLYAMVGKLANIVEEIGEVQKVAEDILKNIVGGGEMDVEQKGKDAVTVKFRTRLTFATNVVPRFRDKSDGLWRRCMFIPFNVQVLDPKKQNRNFVEGSWWVSSGEIQGILNWALEGLARLTKRGMFIEPHSSLLLKEEFKSEANPAATFLLENYEIRESGNMCSNQLYLHYSKAIRSHGGSPLEVTPRI